MRLFSSSELLLLLPAPRLLLPLNKLLLLGQKVLLFLLVQRHNCRQGLF